MPRGEGFSVDRGGDLGVWVRQKPFSLWVIAGGLVYSALALVTLGLPIAIAAGILAGGGFLLIPFVFIALSLVAAAFALRQKRWAYVLGAVVSILLIVLFSPNIASSLSNPADSGFWLSISVLPALVLVVVFSVTSFRNAKRGLAQKRYLASPQSTGGLLMLGVVGFVVGSLVAGAIGACVITRLAEKAGTVADIRIVPNAAFVAVPYDPATFTMSVGTTVMWVNTDSTAHTVTSDAGTPVSFDSGPLTTGGASR